MTAGGAPGWHPDPTGRHGLRWWDGAQWTATVSTNGTVGDDPVEQAAPADRSMLDAPSLALDITATGMRRNGVWRAYDRAAGREVGWMTVDHGDLLDRAAYGVFNARGEVLLRLERPSRVGHLTLLIRDHRGVLVGRIVHPGPAMQLMAPATADPQSPEVVWATAQLPGRPPIGTRAKRLTGLPLRLHDGTPIGGVYFEERRLGPSWLFVDRSPDLPEALQILTVAFAPFFALFLKDLSGRPAAGTSI